MLSCVSETSKEEPIEAAPSPASEEARGPYIITIDTAEMTATAAG